MPLAQTTLEPGGTTTVVLWRGGGGSLLLKLQADSAKSADSIAKRNTRM